MTASLSSVSSPEQADRVFQERMERGQQIYAEFIQPLLSMEDHGKFVAIDVTTGTYALDANDYSAVARLEALCPGAELWLMRAGHTTAYRMRSRSANGSL